MTGRSRSGGGERGLSRRLWHPTSTRRTEFYIGVGVWRCIKSEVGQSLGWPDEGASPANIEDNTRRIEFTRKDPTNPQNRAHVSAAHMEPLEITHATFCRCERCQKVEH